MKYNIDKDMAIMELKNKGLSLAKIAEEFNKRFNTNITRNSVLSRLRRLEENGVRKDIPINDLAKARSLLSKLIITDVIETPYGVVKIIETQDKEGNIIDIDIKGERSAKAYINKHC
jgi:DNA-binding Lrp family transcriptional regulator